MRLDVKMPTPLKLLTVKDVQSSSPILSWVFQSYGFLDSDHHPPSLPSNQKSMEKVTITFTGDLKIGSKNSRVIHNWLDAYSGDGPYPSKELYYLGVTGFEVDWVQICQRNFISSDCMDEVNFWIPAHVGDQVLILLDQQWNNYIIQQMTEEEIVISSIDNSSIHKLIYLNPAQKVKKRGEMVNGAWKVFGGEDQPYLIWFHSGELDSTFIDKYLGES